MSDREVWITGTGAVTPAGWTVAETWNAVVEGKSNIRRVQRFDTFSAATKIGGAVPGHEGPVSEDHPLSIEFGASAIDQAMEQAGVETGKVGLLVAANHGEHRAPRDGRDSFIAPMMTVAQVLAERVGAPRNSGVYGACAGGVLAIGAAIEAIRSGMIDTAVAGGTDALLRPVDFFQFCSLYAMSSRDCLPEEACCPFDARRDGFVIAEGAAFVVLESPESARRRGAEPLAVIEGWGAAQNAYHMVASPPDAEGPRRAMHSALIDADRSPESVGYVNAHGTSTRDNDWCETLAIRKEFGDHADRLFISSTKSVLGHMMGAAGAVETVLTVEALRHQVTPPTINLDEPDPRCDLDYVPHEARDLSMSVAINNSFGFGGHSASLLMRTP